MKRLNRLFIVALAALSLASCSKKPLFSGNVIEGFLVLEDSDYKFAVQYPSEWLLHYSKTDTAVLREQLAAFDNPRAAAISDSLDDVNPAELLGFYRWYNMENSTDLLIAGVSLTISTQRGIKAKDIESDANLEELKSMMETEYAYNYVGYEALTEPGVETIGGNVYAVLAFNSEGGGSTVTVYQAFTARNDQLFSFSFVSLSEDFDKLLPIYKQMIGSLEL